MRTAIILVTYGHWDQTRNCLNDLLKQSTDKFKIFLVDNGSKDETLQELAAHYPQVKVFASPQNMGFGAANNVGIKLAKEEEQKCVERFDAIFLLNNDTRLPPTTLEKLTCDLEQNPDKIIVPQLRNVDGSLQENWFSNIPHLQFFLNAFRTEKSAARYVNGKTIPVPGTSFLEAQWTNAAAWLMTKETWEKVGGFDENIFMYYEDVDWAFRAKRLGYRFFIDTKISITHLGGGSANNNLSRAQQHDRAQQYVFQKHFGFRGKILSKSFRATRSLIRMLSALPRCFVGDCAKQKREYFRHHLALFREAFK